jgi:hypothetical protein
MIYQIALIALAVIAIKSSSWLLLFIFTVLVLIDLLNNDI